MKYFSSLKLKLIYVFRINDAEHEGCLKIGEATCDDGNVIGLAPNSKPLNEAARKRINQYTQTAGIRYELLYTELALYNRGGLRSFNDKEVHVVLERSGVKKKVFDKVNGANEWFITNLDVVKRAIAAVKEGKESLLSGEVAHGRSPIIFRPEQREAIDKTKRQFKKSNQMLWNAKMRFGKTLSALQVVKDMDFRRTLILTHRPVVDSGWFEDFGKIFYDRSDFAYGSKNNGDSHESLERRTKANGLHYVYFASMQDLRGSELVGGNFDKNNEVFATPWDLIIVDEAHEGTQTELGKAVMAELVKDDTKVLRLSGTPFNLLDDFKEDEIYTWDYVMEQRAKQEWDRVHQGDPNPYAALPVMNIYTYDLGRLLKEFADEDVAFNFREFFRVNEDGGFVHERDVPAFLNLLTKEDKDSCYPFANEEYRGIFRHTLWMLPGVKEAKALSALLQRHPVFQYFNIVNVAGDGDEDEESRDALEAVNNAIGKDPDATRTITLSCGRLTTGVSVPAWTAVFMLSGSYNTAASSYMQTIFRVQTPATINGRVKEQCYVFDFAPDRTLRVLAETAKISAKAGKTSQNDRKIMGDFLNFCPVISIEGSRMDKFDVPRMLEQLKKVYVERVVRNGFEDNSLYNDELLKLGDLELQEFDDLKKIIGQTKAMPKTNQVDINNQGLTGEEYEEKEKLEKKSKKELTEEEKRRREELKKKTKNREAAISILRGISIRMPLLIYGAELDNEDEEVTIDNFAEKIDPRSWQEFMPKGVSKQKFNAFKKYYDPDIFRAAGKRIRAMAKAADKLSVEERIGRITDIFSTFRNPDKETVLTPWRVVNMHMSDTIGGWCFYDETFDEKTGQLDTPRYVDQGDVTRQLFDNVDLAGEVQTKILEINSKTGLYPLYITYSLYRRRLDEYIKAECIDRESVSVQEEQVVWDDIVKDNIYVICNTPMAVGITRRTLFGFRDVERKANIKNEELIKRASNDQESLVKELRTVGFWKGNSSKQEMKFNAVVGNPPYQMMDGGAQASATPVYNLFVNIAKKLQANYVSMIMPARWYSGGKGLDEFRNSMLEDKHISRLDDFLNPETIFPNTNIRGGLCYFLWDINYNSKESLTRVVTHGISGIVADKMRQLKTNNFDMFIRNYEAISIIEKVKAKDFNSIAHHISARKPFGFATDFIKDASFKTSPETLNSPVLCYGKGMCVGYVERNQIKTHQDWIDKWKVLIPRANNIGTELNDDNLNSFICAPGEVTTESYLVVGADLNLDEKKCLNIKCYLSTKFARFMHSMAKSSQDATSKTFIFVPIQDFSKPWTDEELYNKYGLDIFEREYIESMIKPME